MFWLRLIYSRLYGLLRKNRIEQEMDDEMRFHLLMRARENIERGMRPDDAEREARRRFGNVGYIKEMGRDIKGGGFIEILLRDCLRQSLRLFRHEKQYAAACIVALSLGIAASTALFAVVYKVLIQPLPYKDSERLVVVWEKNIKEGQIRQNVAPPTFLDWRAQQRSFTDMAAGEPWIVTLTEQGAPQEYWGLSSNAALFSLLGVPPLLGRTFTSAEEVSGKDQVVVISYDFWQSRLGGKSEVIGTHLKLDGATWEIIGVMPRNFRFPPFWIAQTAFWRPLVFKPEILSNRTRRRPRVFAKLKPDYTLSQAQSDMDLVARNIEQRFPDSNSGWGAEVTSFSSLYAEKFRPTLKILFAMSVCLLLMACANVANLLLARGTARQKELAVRAALGASRGRLIGLLLTESLLLSLAGAVVGAVLAFWLVKPIAYIIPNPSSDPTVGLDEIGMNMTALMFSIMAAVITGIIFGMAPAIAGSKLNLQEILQENGRSSSAGARMKKYRMGLVAAETALVMTLLSISALVIHSYWSLIKTDLGFQTRNILTVRLPLSTRDYAEPYKRYTFYRDLFSRIKSLPGAVSASAVNDLPLGGDWAESSFRLEGELPDPARKRIADIRVIDGDYFKTMSIPLREGRAFTLQDKDYMHGPIIVNEAFARQFWPNESALGKRLIVDTFPNYPVEIVGVVGNIRDRGVESPSRPEIYHPYPILSPSQMYLMIRTEQNPLLLARAVREQIWKVDRGLALQDIVPLDTVAWKSVAQPRFMFLILVSFASVAVALACHGIYSVVNYVLTERRQEMGIRIALGAQRNDILGTVVKSEFIGVILGVFIGTAGSLAAGNFLKNLLYQVEPTDPSAFMTSALLVFTIAILGAYFPVRRVMKVDPLSAILS
jgi:putative ABC transport system permease protein